MLLKNKLNDIKNLLQNDNVLANLEERYCYAVDASNFETQFKIPDLVVFVEKIDDVQKVLKYANAHEIPIIARGAGTNMVGSCVCTNGGIVLNFSKMNKILDFNPIDMTIKVQPGVVLGDLKSFVEKKGLFYPPDPSNFKVSTIGGSIAQSSAGANAFKYGTTKDYILSLKIVTAEGNLITLGAETIKDTCGYHLSQLMIGSEGTLGIIVEAVLKLIPKPESKKVIASYFNSVRDAVLAVNEIITQKIFPSAMDFMDNNSLKTVENFAHCGLKVNYNCMLLIEVDGYESSIKELVCRIEQALLKTNAVEIIIAKSDNEAEKMWEARRASFAAASRLAPDILSDDIVVPRSKLADMIEKCIKTTNVYNLKMCLVGHIGDGNLHPQIALNIENETEYENYIKAKSEIYKTVEELGGVISAEHGIGIEKLAYLENTIDKNSLEYMKMIKRIFDPKNILNPGKIFKL